MPAPRGVRLAALLHQAATSLLARQCAGDLDEARLEAELLYGHATGLDRAHVIGAGGQPPDLDGWAAFEPLLARRLAHEPLAYILGRREFFGLTLEVGPGVLVPRPETETLVEHGLQAIREHPRARRLVRVADIGTGSGAIAIAVAKHSPTAQVFAVDASTEALAVAGRNRETAGVRDRVVLLAGDLLEPLGEPLDVLMANLPYIPSEEVDALPEEIRAHEPRISVDGGEDGLDLVRRLLEQAPAHLASDAWSLLLEVGAGQGRYVAGLVEEALGAPAITYRDLGGVRRVVEARSGYAGWPPAS